MHSRIFTVRTRFEVKKDDFESYHDEEDLRALLNIDYVSKLYDTEELVQSAIWLAKSYGIIVELESFKTFSGHKTFSVIKKSEIPKLIENLQISMNAYIANLKKAINEMSLSTHDISNIRYLAGRKNEFIFDASNYSLMDDIEYLDYISYNKTEDIIITEIYDYHF